MKRISERQNLWWGFALTIALAVVALVAMPQITQAAQPQTAVEEQNTAKIEAQTRAPLLQDQADHTLMTEGQWTTYLAKDVGFKTTDVDNLALLERTALKSGHDAKKTTTGFHQLKPEPARTEVCQGAWCTTLLKAKTTSSIRPESIGVPNTFSTGNQTQIAANTIVQFRF